MAHRLLAQRDLPIRDSCLHAHLAVEKALKATLMLRGIDPPRIHDIAFLRAELPASDQAWVDPQDLLPLEGWHTWGRYQRPQEPSYAEGADKVAAAARIVKAARTIFGLDIGGEIAGSDAFT